MKQAIQQGGVALGTMVFEFNTAGIGRTAANTGAAFVVFDQKHTSWKIETIRSLIAAPRAADTVPLVRVPATQYHLIPRPFDIDAVGIMAPMIESEGQGRLLVRSAKYPPVGQRGAAFGFAHDAYTDGEVPEKIRSAHDETRPIAQIETTRGVKSVERIAGGGGIDVLRIGHCDLANSLGIPGQFAHPDHVRAVEPVLATWERYGKAAGFMVASVEEGRAKLHQGFRCLA